MANMGDYYSSDPPRANIARDNQIGCIVLITILLLIGFNDNVTIQRIYLTRMPKPTIPMPENVTVSIIDPHMYKMEGTGLQCTDGYYNDTTMAKVDFCRHFGLNSEVYVGKYFVDRGDQICYLATSPEIAEGPTLTKRLRKATSIFGVATYVEKFHNYQPGRMKFLNYLKLKLEECRTIRFNAYHLYNITDENNEKVPEFEFVLARAYVYSPACEQFQLIPALYAPEQRACFYTTKNSDLKRSLECQVLCDHPQVSDEWHASN